MASPFDDEIQTRRELPAETSHDSSFFQISGEEELPDDVDDFAFDRFPSTVEKRDDTTEKKGGKLPAVCINDVLLADYADGGASTEKADAQAVYRQDSLLDVFTEGPQQSLEESSAREQDITVSPGNEDDPAHDFRECQHELLANFSNELSVESVVDSTSTFDQSTAIGGSSFDETAPRGTLRSPPSPSGAVAEVREVAEPIRKAQQEMRDRLEKKDAEEAARIVELKEIARQELEDWFVRYNEQLKKTKVRNKEAQEVFVEERDRASEKGKEWERMGNMCNFSNKGYRGRKDVSRMKSILMQLKQTPPAVVE